MCSIVAKFLTSPIIFSCRTYSERMTCVEECFSAFEYVAPHRHVAQSCVHAACSRSTLQASDKVGYLKIVAICQSLFY